MDLKLKNFLTHRLSPILLLAISLAIGCDDDEPMPRDNQNITTPGENADTEDQQENQDPNQGEEQEDGSCAEVECEDGSVCIEGTCEATVPEGFGCSTPHRLEIGR